MDWNWEAIRHALIVAWPPIATVAVILLIVIVTALQVKRFARTKAPAPEKSPGIQFLEDALADEPVRKPNPNYTYQQFKEDLYNQKLTFDEIYEKCGGVLPQKPPPPPPPILPMSIHEIQGQNAGDGSQGSEGPDGRCPDRMTQLQQWFKQRTETVAPRKLVPPPPAPHTIIHKIYTRGRR